MNVPRRTYAFSTRSQATVVTNAKKRNEMMPVLETSEETLIQKLTNAPISSGNITRLF
jgi:hypothetical protein